MAESERVTLRPEEAAQRLGVSRTVVYRLIAEGRIRSLKIGRSRRVSVDALRAFVEAEEHGLVAVRRPVEAQA